MMAVKPENRKYSWAPRLKAWRDFGIVHILAVISMASLCSAVSIKDAEAIPAFARKHNLICNACHTRQPRLNIYGQRFMENGYQLPGTTEGGRKAKDFLGNAINGVSLDRLGNYMAVRIRGDIQKPEFAVGDDTEAEDAVEIIFPSVVNLFIAATIFENISVFAEGEYATRGMEDPAMRFERTYMTFNNLTSSQALNIKVGEFDPSALYSFPTHRQMINPVTAVAETNKYLPKIDRIPLFPLAFAAKMFGLSRGPGYAGVETPGGSAKSSIDPAQLKDGFSILPFEAFLFNAPVQTGMAIYGRPSGNRFLYQIGVTENKTAEDVAATRWDSYIMLRYDLQRQYSNLQLSAFYYTAPKAARPVVRLNDVLYYSNNAVDWLRTGIAARWQYKAWDIYGTLIWDKIDEPDYSGNTALQGGASSWDTDAMGVSVEADYLLTEKWLLGARYDLMDAGGLLRGSTTMAAWDEDLAQDTSFLALIGKYYLAPNIGLYARYHHNLKSGQKLPTATGGAEHPARNLRSMFLFGVDMAF